MALAMGRLPDANRPGNAYNTNSKTTTVQDSGDGRFDYNPTDQDRLSFTVIFANSSAEEDRLLQDNAPAADVNDGVDGAEVNADLFGEQHESPFGSSGQPFQVRQSIVSENGDSPKQANRIM